MLNPFTYFRLREDLANHFVIGTVLYWLGTFYSPELGLGLAVVMALIKDVVHDKLLGKGTFDPWDIVCTIAPAAGLYAQQYLHG